CVRDRIQRIEVAPAIRERILGNIDDAEEASGWHCSPELICRPRPLQHSSDAFGIRKHVELLDPDTHPLDPRVGKAHRADSFGKTLAQIDMPCAPDLADRGDDFLVIDDPPAVVAGKRGARSCNQVDRDANALLLLAFAPANTDAAHQHEPAHGDGIAVGRCQGVGVALYHSATTGRTEPTGANVPDPRPGRARGGARGGDPGGRENRGARQSDPAPTPTRDAPSSSGPASTPSRLGEEGGPFPAGGGGGG